MRVLYACTVVPRGTQSTTNGNPVDHDFAPNGTRSYSGNTTYVAVAEHDGATVFNGGGDVNECVDVNERFGEAWEQTAVVEGIERQIIWDCPFIVAAMGDPAPIVITADTPGNDTDLTVYRIRS